MIYMVIILLVMLLHSTFILASYRAYKLKGDGSRVPSYYIRALVVYICRVVWTVVPQKLKKALKREFHFYRVN